MFWRYKTIATDPATSLLQSPIFVVSQMLELWALELQNAEGFAPVEDDSERPFLQFFFGLEHAGIIESWSVYRAGAHNFCLLFLATASLLLAWRSGALAWHRHMLLSIQSVRTCRCITSIQARYQCLSLCFSLSSLRFAIVFPPTHSTSSRR